MSERSTASIYTRFFGLAHEPFSISPDPRYLFMSPRHHEALAHLLYGAASGGGVVVLSGEIGTGKTTLCRCFLEQLPDDCEVAYVFNPKLSVAELLQTICEEFHVQVERGDGAAAGVKDHVDALNRHLLAMHASGRRSVLIIDEAQNLSIDVLEQLRLLTNLETSERKLLQIILIGQPELREMLARPELEQLAQRVIARYHLQALSEQETASYIQHRLSTAGLAAASPFQPPLMRRVHQFTGGVPRRINLLCDRALLGAYSCDRSQVDRETLERAARELFDPSRTKGSRRTRALAAALVVVALGAGAFAWRQGWTAHAMQDLASLAGSVPHASPAPLAAAGSAPPKVAAGTVNLPARLPVEQPATTAPAPAVAEQVSLAPSQPLILDPESGPSRAALHGSDEALRQLAAMWGADATASESCATLQEAGVRCYAGSGGLAELRRLDRPAVIELKAGDGKPSYAILERMHDTDALLRAGEDTQTVSLVLLSRYFSGNFSTLWRLPRLYGDVVREGDEGTEVDWIAAQLAKASHAEAPTGPQHFDARMLEQVREFQRAQGLHVDGVIGPATFMQLNRVAGVAEPALRAAPAATATPATTAADGV